MDPEVIYQIVVSYLPAITSIGGIIGACVKIVKDSKNIKNLVKKTAESEYNAYKQQNTILIEALEELKQENKQLRGYNEAILKKIDRIERSDNDENQKI